MNKQCHFCGANIKDGGNSIYPFNYIDKYKEDICCNRCNAYIIPFRKILQPNNSRVSLNELEEIDYNIRENLADLRRQQNE